MNGDPAEQLLLTRIISDITRETNEYRDLLFGTVFRDFCHERIVQRSFLKTGFSWQSLYMATHSENMNRFFTFVLNLINRPGKQEDESMTNIVTMREICLLLLIYCPVIGTMMLLYTGNPVWCVYYAAFLYVVYIFHSTYVHPVKTYFIRLIVLLVAGSLGPSMFYGWNLGFQCLLYCALLIVLFNPGFSIKQKKTACLGAILVLVFMEIFILLLSNPRPLDEDAMFKSTQILLVNELFFLFSICLIGLTVATVSQQAEYLLMQNNRKLRDDAGTDPLTGLSNRRATELWFTDVISNYHSSQQLITLAMGDIDFFKKVNDTYGHDAGDYVLKGIADLLKELVNEQCYAARWGGEEFLIIFQGKNGDEVYSVLNLFLVKLRKHDFVYKDNVINVSMTFGIAEYDSNPGMEGTIQEADEKLYFGKQRGRNCVIF